ncbi:unnamed protein product, partial [Iphiclides podalirius]
MRTIAVAVLMILASASAVPQVYDLDERSNVITVIQDAIDRIKELITDPIVVELAEGDYELPIPGIFSATAFVKDISVTGASNIVIDNIDYSETTNKLSLDLSLPEVRARLGAAEAQVTILGFTLRGIADGELAISGLRISSESTVKVDDSGTSVSELVLSSSLEGVQSSIHLNLFGYDLSVYVNNFFGRTLPELLSSYVEPINRILARLILFLLERVL